MQNEPTPDPAAQPRKWRRGDVGPDGRVFWKTHRSRGLAQEVWVSREKFDFNVAREKAQRAAGWALKTPEQRAKKAEKERLRYETREDVRAKVAEAQRLRLLDPEAKAKHKAAVKRWSERRRPEDRKNAQKESSARYRSDPRNRVMLRLRGRLRSCVARALVQEKHPRGEDREAASFLLWCAQRIPGFSFSEWEIDHLWPCAKCKGWPSQEINKPENVRWLPRVENRVRQDADPSPSELAAHGLLLEEWKIETRSQKDA